MWWHGVDDRFVVRVLDVDRVCMIDKRDMIGTWIVMGVIGLAAGIAILLHFM